MKYRLYSLFVLVFFITVSVVIGGAPTPVDAAEEYEISINKSVDTPPRDVDVRGRTYEVSAIGKTEQEEPVSVSVTPPEEGQSYRIYLYNSDGRIVAGSGEVSGNKTIAFNLSAAPGTYAFAIESDGVNQAIHPLVIKGFEATVDAPESVTVGDEVVVNVTATQIEPNVTNDYVEVIIARGDQDIVKIAHETNGQYTARINTTNLEPGSYNVYATVRGDEVVFNRRVIFGISDATTTDLNTTDDSNSGSSGSGNNGGNDSGSENSGTDDSDSGGGDSEPAGGSSETTSKQTATSTPIELTATTQSQEQTTPTTPPESEATTDADNNVATPAETATSPASSETTTQTQRAATETRLPGFSMELIAFVIFLGAVFARAVRD